MSLGYNIKTINNEIIKQLNRGIFLSLPSLLENKFGKKIINEIPSAEMVSSIKNGSDVISAIRLSRMFTNKKIVLHVDTMDGMNGILENKYECRDTKEMFQNKNIQV